MFRALLPVVLLHFLAMPVAAQDQPSCEGASEYCVPWVACVEATGEIFHGASYGHDGGALVARSSGGVLCKGNWQRTFMGIGIATFDCSDGRSGQSSFTWFEPETGTAVGSGNFSNGEVTRFWAGNNLARYFREVSPEEEVRMACSINDMIIS